MEFSCSAMIVRSRGTACTSVDLQHLNVLLISSIACRCVAANCSIGGQEMGKFFFLLALQPPLGVVFYSHLADFSLLAYEVS